jgi:hypothetical protein
MSSEDVIALVERLVRIETKLDQSNRTHDDHEGRIRKLERALWIVAGAGLVGGGLAGQLAPYLFGG